MYNTNDRVYVRQSLQAGLAGLPSLLMKRWRNRNHRDAQQAWQSALEAAVAVRARRQDVSSRRFFSGSEGIMA